MAYTASTGFRYGKSLLGSQSPMALKIRAGDSKTLTIGDAVRVNTSGLIDLVGAGNPVLGVIQGLVDENGGNLLALGYTNNTGATLSGDDTVTTASDNSPRTHYIMAEGLFRPAGSWLWHHPRIRHWAHANLFQLFDVLAA